MKAEYIDHMGDDLRAVNAARVSFDKESEYRYEDDPTDPTCPPQVGLWEKDKRLLEYLAKNGHFTPFTHPQITIRETVPIFVARQRFKHTVGFSYNEVSRRYVDSAPEFFTPEEWRGKPTNGAKQGSSDVVIDDLNAVINWSTDGSCRLVTAYETFLLDVGNFYHNLIRIGVAPEQARMVLPQSMYTSYYVTGSLAAWARAYNLRSDEHAQKEIRDLAKQWDNIIRPLFPVSWEALTKES